MENYVEHIRRLSNDHEALTLEFEAENEQLKAEVDKLNAELEGKCRNHHIRSKDRKLLNTTLISLHCLTLSVYEFTCLENVSICTTGIRIGLN